MPTSSTKNASVPQMTSLATGTSGFGASWQSSTSPPSSRMSHALLGLFVGELGLPFAFLREGRAGEREHRENNAQKRER